MCRCKPGKYEEGWQEYRCADCLKAERDVWTEMLRRYQESDTLLTIRVTHEDAPNFKFVRTPDGRVTLVPFNA